MRARALHRHAACDRISLVFPAFLFHYAPFEMLHTPDRRGEEVLKRTSEKPTKYIIEVHNNKMLVNSRMGEHKKVHEKYNKRENVIE